jgi:hypothetical protein
MAVQVIITECVDTLLQLLSVVLGIVLLFTLEDGQIFCLWLASPET